ncbi:DEAD/DEAH box helicase [Halalkalibacter urbisdiaboli]|uniref:DEAD/DEAH box helicase n=1 Tax=Halalkalibacter urbisdiaboli TaxID=1960589 RepID=UPI000B439824|nr:DEAD/DEAH box helicase [Halalkalibacter urbisdiaboli]
MNSLTELYPRAVAQTKKKVSEDLDRFLGSKETKPDFEQYLFERAEYLEQIWKNIWINKASNEVSKRDKKQYLTENGYVVEGVDRRIINKLFRSEIKFYEPFDVVTWFKRRFADDKAEWNTRYVTARQAYLKREEEERLADLRLKAVQTVEQMVQMILKHQKDKLYLQVRYLVACHLADDVNNKPKYQLVEHDNADDRLMEIGPFQSCEYQTVGRFFDELTGDVERYDEWGGYYYAYETYHDVYNDLIHHEMVEQVTQEVTESLDSSITKEYAEGFGEELTKSTLESIVSKQLSRLHQVFLTAINEEILANMLALADVPFNEQTHKKLLEEAIADRERKIAEELAEIERKKEEEARMIDYIFGREYRASQGRDIKYVLHIGETNTGKTHHALEKMKAAKSGLYLAPLRLLALEVYDRLNADKVPCALKTGEEEKEVEGARHISCTVEMFYEKEFYDVVVIDEAQMIADKDRGFSWYKAITKTNANEVHIIGSRNVKDMIIQLLGDSDVTVYDYSRDIPLKVEMKEFKMSHTKKGDALVCFSRRRVLETASQLQKSGHSVSMIYGSMPPETRKKQMQRFIEGETTVIVSTDAIGMGLNLPIRRIVFLENEKFDGTRRRRLTSQEIKQIAGRAGRKGIYDVGKVAFTSDIKLMKQLLNKEDDPIQTFAIAPTNSVFERFLQYSRDLGRFFELWDKFESPKGTKKASLAEERDLYKTVKGTEIEARLSMMDLYGFLHLPFSSKEPELIKQWLEKMKAIVSRNELPEPQLKKGSLEDLELAYKSVGLHLLFLYRLEQRTEALYWERVREEMSDVIHDYLKNDLRNLTKKCKHCGKKLSWEHSFSMCDECHSFRYRRKHNYAFSDY